MPAATPGSVLGRFGALKNVDAAHGTFTLAPFDGSGECDYTTGPDLAITVSGVPASLSDLKSGQHAAVTEKNGVPLQIIAEEYRRP